MCNQFRKKDVWIREYLGSICYVPCLVWIGFSPTRINEFVEKRMGAEKKLAIDYIQIAFLEKQLILVFPYTRNPGLWKTRFSIFTD